MQTVKAWEEASIVLRRVSRRGLCALKSTLLLTTFLSIAFCCSTKKASQEINLAGTWGFKIDSLNQGVKEAWFNGHFQDTVHLPGSMNANGKGNDIGLKTHWTGQIVDSSFFKNPEYAKYRQPGNFKIPFWLQPLKHYVGAAWYQKTVEIPGNWKNKHIDLFLERCHWETTVWVDGQKAGMKNTLGSPHIFDLTEWLTPGKHRVTIRVDNRIKDIDVGINAHSITDHKFTLSTRRFIPTSTKN